LSARQRLLDLILDVVRERAPPRALILVRRAGCGVAQGALPFLKPVQRAITEPLRRRFIDWPHLVVLFRFLEVWAGLQVRMHEDWSCDAHQQHGYAQRRERGYEKRHARAHPPFPVSVGWEQFTDLLKPYRRRAKRCYGRDGFAEQVEPATKSVRDIAKLARIATA
jgi:hypothetical protein